MRARQDFLKAQIRLIDTLEPYLHHQRGCEIDMTEFCTCGLREARETATADMKHMRDLFDAANAPPNAAPAAPRE